MTQEKELKKKFAPIAWVFYLLIVFEIVYMSSPFALYYYSAYGPGLAFLDNSPLTSWLSWFFLPHFSQTSSGLLNSLHDAGWIFFGLGLVVFLIGAGQIYYAKFTKKGGVTGGLYKYVRNPQYTAFAAMGFGLLLIWPRFIVLVMWMLMLFVYYFLAKKEEKECQEKYGDSFREYAARTSMFVPGDSVLSGRPRSFDLVGVKRVAAVCLLLFVLLGTAVAGGFILRNYSISTLSALYGNDAATISTYSMGAEDLEKIMSIAGGHPEVKRRLNDAGYGSGKKLLNYILPLEWVIPDLPLDPAHISIRDHNQSMDIGGDTFKVLFTAARLKEGVRDNEPQGVDIIKETAGRVPIIVVKLNKETGDILALETPPPHVLWGDIPTPLF